MTRYRHSTVATTLLSLFFPAVAVAAPGPAVVGPPPTASAAACRFEVPNGATVNANNGEVTLGGTVIAIDDCLVPIASPVPTPGPLTCVAYDQTCTINSNGTDNCCIGGGNGLSCNPYHLKCGDGPTEGYPLWSGSGSVNVGYGSYGRFNQLYTQYYVPNSPYSGSNAGFAPLWSGLTNTVSGPGSSGVSILQPELYWDDAASPEGWFMSAQFEVEVSGLPKTANGPAVRVTAGDRLISIVAQISATEWTIELDDVTSNVYSQVNAIPNTSWRGYDGVYMGVYEMQGLISCHAFPNQDEEIFYLNTLTEAGAAWNDYIDVMGTVNWTTGVGTDFHTQCDYGAEVLVGSGGCGCEVNETYFSWNNNP
jgi:hypothetical protein